MTTPAPLSPAAQAVTQAIDEVRWDWGNMQEADASIIAATALRAAADQVVPDDYDPPRGVSYPEKDAFVDGKCVHNEDIRFQLLAVAAELEGRND